MLRRSKKMFQREKCAPKPRGTKKLSYTCYNPSDLDMLKNSWNQRNPTNKIVSVDPYQTWNDLKAKNAACNKESCWLDNNKPLYKRTFAPKMPPSWKKNINEWLSSDEILEVLTQYETMYPEFEFLGPSPTDYFVKEYGNTCVWEELCKFNLKEWIAKGKTKIGVVFNLDPHYKSGSHWVALFINTVTKSIYYFDSTGARIHKYINRFRKEVQAQAKRDLGEKYAFDTNYQVEHQYKNTECGMYVLFFIITMLMHDQKYVDPNAPVEIGKALKQKLSASVGGGATLFESVFKNNRLKFPDKLMEGLRYEYFNK
jgi:hypothetical protein